MPHPPLFGRPLIVVAVLLYFLACLGLGVWALRRTRSARDFWVARQGLGVVVTGLATMAAAFSGFVFLGGPGLTYRIGLSSLFINLSIGFTPALLAWTLAKRLRLLADDLLSLMDELGIERAVHAMARSHETRAWEIIPLI